MGWDARWVEGGDLDMGTLNIPWIPCVPDGIVQASSVRNYSVSEKACN
jgi:hypothetical protein